ncbi:MAG: S8 family serine peptidase, partial [Phycisphaerae bacterium]
MYASRIDTAASWDFNNNDPNPDDDHGHGSHVAGIAVGGALTIDLGCDGVEPFQGVAPGATLIGAKILNSAGGGTTSNIIAGIDHCADQSPSGGRADVINLSIGTGNFAGTCDTHSWAAAANAAVANGVVVVAASGNECNTNSMGSPACGSDVIAVGAVYKANYPNCENGTSSFNWGCCSDNGVQADDIVCFSNQSDLLDVAAPGSVIRSASNAAGGMSTTSMSGTSMASPMVAGLAALILSADPNLTPAEVRQIIRDGAVDLGAPGFDRAYGFGRIDAINSLSLVTPCTTNAECDDGDPCTTDVCSSGSCSNTPITCPAGQTCIGGTCQGQGACCTGATCNIDNPTSCSAAGGTYLGDGSVCGSGTAGSPTVYQNSPNVSIPDGGGAGNPATDTITVPDSVTIGDVDVDLTITHTWVGDVTVTVSHLGTTVTVLDRPGVPGSTFGCSLNNFSGIVLDDEGTGGAIEDQCVTNLSSPPNYTPNSPLSAFDGMDSAGVWTITVYDSATPDPGTLNTWSLHIDAVGSNPCTAVCTTDAECDDGVFCNGAETCVSGACVAGTAVDCNDGIGCTDDACNEATDSCDNVVNNANCDDGLF